MILYNFIFLRIMGTSYKKWLEMVILLLTNPEN